METLKEKIEDYKKEEWGGWKIVSEMLDNPDEDHLYPTSKCYQKLYEFVCKQKDKAKEETKREIMGIIEEKREEILGSISESDATNMKAVKFAKTKILYDILKSIEV